jgi:hypothetical protein
MQLCVDMTIKRKGLDLALKLKVTFLVPQNNYFIRVTYIFLQCSEYCKCTEQISTQAIWNSLWIIQWTMIHKRKGIFCRASCVFFTCELVLATIDNEIVIVLIFLVPWLHTQLKAGLHILLSLLLRISKVNTVWTVWAWGSRIRPYLGRGPMILQPRLILLTPRFSNGEFCAECLFFCRRRFCLVYKWRAKKGKHRFAWKNMRVGSYNNYYSLTYNMCSAYKGL